MKATEMFLKIVPICTIKGQLIDQKLFVGHRYDRIEKVQKHVL
jgi:hypothetical protein